MAMKVVPYAAEWKARWDTFIDGSKNGTFLFRRDYMEYHADRFHDASLLFVDDDKLVAVMPANVDGDRVLSHGGLTFGGIITDRRMRTATMLALFDDLRAHLRAAGAKTLTYKRVPYIYHDVPSDEDLYALFRNDARLVRCDVSVAVSQADPPPYAKGRSSDLSKSRKSELTVGRSDEFEAFMQLETDHLRDRYGVTPVHTVEAMRLLASRFPDNIKLFTAARDGKLLAGAVVYESKHVAHTQYIGHTEEGRRLCAPAALFDFLLHREYVGKRYFDFGTSNEDQGRALNEGLIDNKEGYGARAVVHEFFEMAV